VASISLPELWVHQASNLATFVKVHAGTISEETQISGEVRRYANGVFRAITVAGTSRTVAVSLPFLARADLKILEGWVGLPVMVRDPLGRKVFGVFFRLDTSERPLGDINTALQSGFSLSTLSLSEEV